VREPKAPLRNGALRYASDVLLERLRARTPPASLAALIELEKRANRSDLLESIWMVVTCLLAFMSLKSLRVGYRQRRGRKHDLVGLSVERISHMCGLSISTVSHVLTLLRRCGYVHGPAKDGVNAIKQPWERLDHGALAPLPAIRRFQFQFFSELGGGVGALVAEKRLAQPAPAAPATVHPESARALVQALGDQHGHPESTRGRPPDG
jgi:DNA-binding transcriptional ArsR family regulator